MRKLASIQTIDNITPIPDAVAIDVARILGWNVVVKKGEFQIGDKCVYCEIDSIMPSDNPAFAFLETCRYRIKTKKLRGVVSQGICFPMSILPEGNYEIDDDVTDILGITKYDPEVSIAFGGEGSSFPSFVSKTDETRVQTFGRALARNFGILCDYTEKLDGTSATYFFRDGSFGFCSRNLQLKGTDNIYYKIAEKYSLEKLLRDMNAEDDSCEFAIQGEIIGPGIQGNKYQLDEHEFRVFNVIDLRDNYVYNNKEVQMFCGINDLLAVPYLGEYSLTNDVDKIVEMSIGKSKLNPKIEREGIVIRSMATMYDSFEGRLSFKAINPKFLLKYDA